MNGTPEVDAADLRGASPLERDFALRWATLKHAPELRREFCWSRRRQWRFDFAHPGSKVAIELDGGIWRGTKGAHGGRGAIRDREKDFDAIMDGWAVIRLTPEMAKDHGRLWGIVNLILTRQDPYHVATDPYAYPDDQA